MDSINLNPKALFVLFVTVHKDISSSIIRKCYNQSLYCSQHLTKKFWVRRLEYFSHIHPITNFESDYSGGTPQFYTKHCDNSPNCTERRQ